MEEKTLDRDHEASREIPFPTNEIVAEPQGIEPSLSKSEIENTVVYLSIWLSVLIATLILVCTFVYFYVNQGFLTKSIDDAIKLFNKSLPNNTYSQFGNNAENSAPLALEILNNELFTLRMEYLERLSELHKQATSRDLFVFIYGFLSSVLIVVSANSAKKGDNKLKEIIGLVEKEKAQLEILSTNISANISAISANFSEKQVALEEIARKIETHNNSLLELDDKCAILDKENKKLAFQENSIRLSFISQRLLEAQTSISNYNTTLKIDVLVQFKRSIWQASNLCDDTDFSIIDEYSRYNYEKRLEEIKELYNDSANKPGTAIDEFHKKYIYKDFAKIEAKLKE